MIPINLDFLIGTITDIVSPTAFIKDKLQRNETVIKLLKQFNLDPDHPPADFSGVYAYALVEYGVGKPKPILALFRQTEMQQIFRKALDQNNPSILLREGEAFFVIMLWGMKYENWELTPSVSLRRLRQCLSKWQSDRAHQQKFSLTRKLTHYTKRSERSKNVLTGSRH